MSEVMNVGVMNVGQSIQRGKDDCISRSERQKGAKDEVTTRVQRPKAVVLSKKRNMCSGLWIVDAIDWHFFL